MNGQMGFNQAQSGAGGPPPLMNAGPTGMPMNPQTNMQAGQMYMPNNPMNQFNQSPQVYNYQQQQPQYSQMPNQPGNFF